LTIFPFAKTAAIFFAGRTPLRGGPIRECVAPLRSVTQVRGMSDLQQDLSKRPDDMIHVRLPSDLRAAIERAAALEHRTLSQQIRFLICTGIEARSQPRHAA
jgi:hypothetical protein